jgi:hypothetical protein
VGFATPHASTCHVYSPSTTPSPDTTAIIVYNNAYTILHRDDTIIHFVRGGARIIQPVACARRCARAPWSPCRRVGGRTAHRSLGRSVYEMGRRPMNGSPSPASIQRQQRRERAKLSRVKRPPGRPSSWDSDGCRERVVDAMRLDGFFGPFTLGRGRYHTVARVCSAVRRHATACKLFGTSGVECVADDAVLMTGLPSAVGTDAVHRDCPGLRCDQQQYQFIACLKGQMYLQLERRVSVRRKPASSRPSHRGIAIEIHQGQVLFFFGSRYAHRPEIAKECTRVAGWVCAAGQRVIEYDETNSYEILEGWRN